MEKPNREPVRFVVVGCGGIGQVHAQNIAESREAVLVSVCDVDLDLVRKTADRYGCEGFTDWTTMFDKATPEACIVSTPHMHHLEPAKSAFERGIHTLVVKPLAEQVRDAFEMVRSYRTHRLKHPDMIFATSYTLRLFTHYRAAREILQKEELGKLQRATFVSTKWYRTNAYFAEKPWRGTWAGEGGGVLLNQCIHDLDLYQWLLGRPIAVFAELAFGKYHRIEVEDEATLLMKHEDGLIGQFVGSTAEYPGTERLEIVGEYGSLVCQDGNVTVTYTPRSGLETIRESEDSSPAPPSSSRLLSIPENPGHDQRYLLKNFVSAIENGESLLSPGEEGLDSLAIANAAVLSSASASWQPVPPDADDYAELLESYCHRGS